MPLFGTDRVLMYDVAPWNQLGFGVPNFGSKSKLAPGSIDTIGTLNVELHGLADEISKYQLFIMTHVDAMRSQPPSRNTIERLGKMLNRISSVLAARAMDFNDLLTEEGHQRPALRIWNIRPVPYFKGPFLKNPWLIQYNEYCMTALTNFYQHSDNNLALTVTKRFAQDVYQHFRIMKVRMGNELLGIPRADLELDTFVFTSAHYDNYHPEAVTMSIEAIDGPGNMQSLPTEVDIELLLRGIPANLILPVLKQYPIGPIPGATGEAGEDTFDETASAAGTAPTVGGSDAIGGPVI